jgi:tetratricopeptide (TPR) repeat protein
MTGGVTGKQPTAQAKSYAAARNIAGLEYYANWEIDKAVAAFSEASSADPGNPEYHLNLARSYARGSNYQEAVQSLGDYLRTETNENIAERYERLFSSALDEVETILIDKTAELGLPVQQTGKAIQMWLEYRITLGRQTLEIQQPAEWAAALTLAICKINFLPFSRAQIAALYAVSEEQLKQKSNELVRVLDLMPADYRYFTGENNPLDKLVEAAQMLDDLYDRFQDQ